MSPLFKTLSQPRISSIVLTQNTVRRNWPSAPAAIRPLGLDRQFPLLARAHAEQALVPALDHLAAANLEAERLTAVVGGVELRAVGFESAAVVL